MTVIDSATADRDVDPLSPGTTHAPVILLVEDEALLRVVTADRLRDCGYAVLEAADADEAMETLQGMVHVDAVLSDVRMTGQHNGVALARWIKARDADLLVILVSGDERPPDIRPGEIEAFFAKPYDVSEVADYVASRLGN